MKKAKVLKPLCFFSYAINSSKRKINTWKGIEELFEGRVNNFVYSILLLNFGTLKER